MMQKRMSLMPLIIDIAVSPVEEDKSSYKSAKSSFY
jgi:hypothetical protein